jgi:hypothetical protein
MGFFQPASKKRRIALLCVAGLLAAGALTRADAPASAVLPSGSVASAQTKSLFDPARHMLVSEIKPGMKGYGLSVFSGEKIEKFDVEVVNVVHDFNPKYDAILIRCPGEYLKGTGPIAGMSGSPIYLYGTDGRPRMIGAFAYGWPFAKDCLAGVQPIQYMLGLPANDSPPAAENAAQSSAGHSSPEKEAFPPHWSLRDVPMRPWGKPARAAARHSATSSGNTTGSDIRLRPLATPLMAGGIGAEALAKIAPLFEGTGLVPMQVGTGMGSMAAGDDPRLEPGSVLAVPLLTGDMELTAVGTCTERIGDRIFGFGHPFNNEGPINLPMGSGSIATVVSNLETSFKLGFLARPSGTLLTDQTVGVAGTVGRLAPMIPLEIRIVYDDGSLDQTYHFKAALHPKLTPMITAAAVLMALTGDRNLPQYYTTDYDLTADFVGGDSVHIVNRSTNSDGNEMIADMALPLLATSDNPFKSVALSNLHGTIHVSNNVRSADILSVMVPRTKYAPGETVKAYISYQPFHAEVTTMETSIELPHDLPNGPYQFIVSDWTKYLEDEKTADPFKFDASSIGDLFAVIKDVVGIRHDAVYLRLVRQPDGIAVGRTAMPRLPSSQRQVLLDTGRSNITPIVSSTVKVVPSDCVMSGSAEFTINIDRDARVETTSRPSELQDTSSDGGPTPGQ